MSVFEKYGEHFTTHHHSDGHVEIGVRGCGMQEMDPGFDRVVYLEVKDGKPMLYVWADINSGDVTHKIDLSGALEIHRERTLDPVAEEIQ